jgi:hypothetical protein
MGMGSMISAILFLAGIGAIFASGGVSTYMTAGDALVALAALSFVKFSK